MAGSATRVVPFPLDLRWHLVTSDQGRVEQIFKSIG